MKNWLVKVKNTEGWHKIKDIIAPSLDDKDQGNYYDLENIGKVHQNNIEDMKEPHVYEDPWDQAKYDRKNEEKKPAVLDIRDYKKKLLKSVISKRNAKAAVKSLIDHIPSDHKYEPGVASTSIDDLLYSYKDEPHNKDSILLKFLTHRLENRKKYSGKSDRVIREMDNEWLDRHKVDPKGNRTSKLGVDDLYTSIKKNPELGHHLIDERAKLHDTIKKMYPHNIVKENGKDHIYLTRGLNVDKHERKDDFSLASYADKAESGFGVHQHWQKVPLDNVWFSYDHKDVPHDYGSENEWLVSPHENNYTDEAPSHVIIRDHHEWARDPDKDTLKSKINYNKRLSTAHRGTSEELDELSNDSTISEDFVNAMSRNKNTKIEHLDKIKAMGDYPSILEAIMKHPDHTTDHINEALDSDKPWSSTAALQSGKLNSDHIDKVLKNANSPSVRSLLNNPHINLNDNHRDTLFNHKDPGVVTRYITSSHATDDHVKQATNHEDEFVRKQAKDEAFKRNINLDPPKMKMAKSMPAKSGRLITKKDLLSHLNKAESTYSTESDDFIFYYSDIDNAGKQVEKAFHDGDLDKIMDVSSRISNSRAILKSYVDRAEGLIIVDGGDDQSGRIRIVNMDVLEDAKREIFNKTGYTVTIGVGYSPKQSVEALAYGKLTGKNKIVFWSKSVEEYIAKVKGITPEEKVAEVFNAQDE